MTTAGRPLIVGAGPVGLAAAVFLSRAGIDARLVEMSPEPSRLSKALAVNPRTLQILEGTGVTERMLAIGLKLKGACLWHGARLAAKIEFDRLQGKYPYMLALSQAVTERLLEETLVDTGGTVERGARLVECTNETGGVTATLDTARGRDDCRAPWMLAADGAHSTARERLGIEFQGSTFRNKWYLADVALDVSLAEDHVHIFFLSKGEFQFMIRVIDPQSREHGRGSLVARGRQPPRPAGSAGDGPLRRPAAVDVRLYRLASHQPAVGGRTGLLRGRCGPRSLARRRSRHESGHRGRLDFRPAGRTRRTGAIPAASPPDRSAGGAPGVDRFARRVVRAGGVGPGPSRNSFAVSCGTSDGADHCRRHGHGSHAGRIRPRGAADAVVGRRKQS